MTFGCAGSRGRFGCYTFPALLAAKNAAKTGAILSDVFGFKETAREGSIIRLSGEFHILLAELAGNAILVRMIRELTAQTCLVITLYDRPNTPACTHHHHADIIEAVEAKDVMLATKRMGKHLNDCENALRLENGVKEEVDLKSIFA